MANDIHRLEVMIEDLRRLREKCEPKRQDNPRYHAYSSAVVSIQGWGVTCGLRGAGLVGGDTPGLGCLNVACGCG